MGGCPDTYESMENFEVERYTGRWYLIVRDSSVPFTFFSECNNVDYDLIEG